MSLNARCKVIATEKPRNNRWFTTPFLSKTQMFEWFWFLLNLVSVRLESLYNVLHKFYPCQENFGFTKRENLPDWTKRHEP